MFRIVETEHLLIQIFRKDQLDTSPVRAVAEAILEYGSDPEGVPSSCINFAIPGKPHSGGQRAREIFAAYRRQWPGMMSMFPLPELQSHVYKGNRYFFTAPFLQWLRASLPEIERIIYSVQSRMKFKD